MTDWLRIPFQDVAATWSMTEPEKVLVKEAIESRLITATLS